MKQELSDRLYKDFPLLYSNLTYGFECDDGWEPLIRELSLLLEISIHRYMKEHAGNIPCRWCGDSLKTCGKVKKSKFGEFKCGKYEPEKPKASQVKEKFGSLRFYMDSPTNEMNDLIYIFQDISGKTCEICGDKGKSCKKGTWVKTLCEDCMEKERYTLCI